MSLTMSGITLPTANFTNSISEKFPITNRKFNVESSILSRYFRDHLPTDENISIGGVSKNYNEFVLNSNDQEFSDLKSFGLKL